MNNSSKNSPAASCERMRTLSLGDARREAQWIYELYSKRRKAHQELLALSDDALHALETLMLPHMQSDDIIRRELAKLRKDTHLKALSECMVPLVEYWQTTHGKVTGTTKCQNPTGKGTSDGLKFLVEEMSKIVDGPALHDRTIKTMLEHVRR